jgi:hypothetical protein
LAWVSRDRGREEVTALAVFAMGFFLILVLDNRLTCIINTLDEIARRIK